MVLQRPYLLWAAFLIKILLLLKYNEHVSSIFDTIMMRNGTRTIIVILPLTFTFLIRGWDRRASTPEVEKVFDESLTQPCTELELVPTISYVALYGGSHPTVFRFIDNVKGSPVKFLLDGANTYNFMHPCVPSFLKLPIETSSKIFSSGGQWSCTKIFGGRSSCLAHHSRIYSLHRVSYHRISGV